MSPVATKSRKPEAVEPVEPAPSVSVTDAIARKREAEMAVKDKHLGAYRLAVATAAAGESVSQAVADAAAEAAAALGIPAARFDRDVAAMKAAVTTETAIEDYRATKDEKFARRAVIRQELQGLEMKRRSLLSEEARHAAAFQINVSMTSLLRDTHAGSPHLFRPVWELDDKAWAAIRR